MQTTEQTTMIKLTIDGTTLSVPKGTTVYTAAKQLGIEIPIFCYHDRMPPFGACRQCLVEVEKMPKLQTSCTLEATEGMVVRTQSKMSVQGREGILEFLLINHPLDCPICDRGGECPLQDQALKYGPGLSRFFEEKRHFDKPLPLGPVLMLDRERCVVCARCTRFGDLIAGDHALEFIDRGFKTEVGTPHGGPAESKFIGNTIMMCPVGALTSQVYRFRARPWDNDSSESTCTLCPVGCSMILDSRDGEVMRTRSCENKDVNDIWLCDKGWFGYEFADSPDRLNTPLIRRSGQLEPATWDEALALVASKFKEAKSKGKLAAFGGIPLTLEENYLYQKLMREVGGVDHVDHRVGMPIISLDDEGIAPDMEISIGDCETLSYAVLFGIDLTEKFPVIWLRLKQAINRGAKVVFIGHYAPEIAPHLAETILHPPRHELEMIRKHLPKIIQQQGKGAIFVGKQYLSTYDRGAIFSELAKFRSPKLSLNILEGKGNSLGARLAGMHPALSPNLKRIQNPGLNVIQILQSAAQHGWDYLHVAGANPAVKYPSKLWNEARSKLKFLVVQDLFLTETAQQADVVLPTLSYVEKSGTFVNISGHHQKLNPGKAIPGNLLSDAAIFIRIAALLGTQLNVDFQFSEGRSEELGAGNQAWGVKSRDSWESSQDWEGKSPDSWGSSQELGVRNKNGLLATFAPALFDHGVRMMHNSHLVELSKEPRVRLHPSEGSKLNIKDGDTVFIEADGNSISGKVKLDDTVAVGTVVLPLGFPEFPVHELCENLLNGMPIELTT